MVKTNFTKVEEILSKGLHKITVNKLLELADIAAGLGRFEEMTSAKERTAATKLARKRLHWVTSIKRDLAWMHKQDKEVYKKLNINKKELKKLLEYPDNLDEKGWKKIEKIFDKVEEFKKEFIKEHYPEGDEDIVEAERLKHINKRFNVSEKWLPLH